MFYRFLDFELDETQYELRFGGQVVPTQQRVFAFIVYLLRHRERVIAKQELIRELWKAQVVSDTAISQVVMLARKALRDEGESQRIIKTVRGRGFRFIADVERGPSGPPETPPEATFTKLRTIERRRETVIGREAEVSQLESQLKAAAAGRGGLVLVEGEPGIGKTTLADEVSARAAALGLDVQWGRAWEEGGAPPFWPWIQVLRGMVKVDGEARVRQWMGRGATELLALLPELESASGDRSEELDRRRTHFQLFDAMARFLSEACQPAAANSGSPRPRLIVLDDLHAVDEASVQLLRFLAPELERHGLLILGTFRDFELRNNEVLAQLASDCESTRRIRLASLGRAQVTAFIERKLGADALPHLEHTLHDASGGNPLLLAELCRRFEHGASHQLAEFAAMRGEPLPERVMRAVRSHLSELPEATRRALESASALGREFALPTLAPLLGVSETELLERLAPALQQGVVRHASGPDHLLFSHSLVCRAVYADMTPHARVELHRQIAEFLERTRRADRASLYEIAHHYGLAAAGGCRPQALHYACLAAARASEMRAYEVAAELYDRALQLAESEGAGDDTLHELACAAGDTWYLVGQLDRAVARFQRAIELSRANQDAERLADAASRLAGAVRGAVLYDRSLLRPLEEALALLPATDDVTRAAALATSALAMRASSSVDERNSLSCAAVDIARRLGDVPTLLWALNARHLAMWGALHPRELLTISNEMVALARKAGDREILLDGLLWRVSSVQELGDVGEALRAREDYEIEIERSGSPWHRYMRLCCLGFEARATGEFARAEELSESALHWGKRLREPLAEGFHEVRRLFARFDEGLVHDPFPCEPPSSVPNDYRPFWALAWAQKGRKTEAQRCVAQLLANAESGLVLDALRRPALSVMAEVCAILEHREHAARIYPLLLPSAGLNSLLQAGVYVGPVSYYLGRLASCLSQLEAASTHFEQALAQVDAFSLPWRARILYGHGRMLVAQAASAARGRVMLQESLDIATHLAMTDLHDAVERALDRTGPSALHHN